MTMTMTTIVMEIMITKKEGLAQGNSQLLIHRLMKRSKQRVVSLK